jgi:hypothetical protein
MSASTPSCWAHAGHGWAPGPGPGPGARRRRDRQSAALDRILKFKIVYDYSEQAEERLKNPRRQLDYRQVRKTVELPGQGGPARLSRRRSGPWAGANDKMSTCLKIAI